MATVDTAPAAPAAPVPPAPELFNAAEWLVTRHAEATPDRRAISAIGLDGSVRTFTYAELDADVRRFAAALLASGVRPEERLLLCMGDTPELLTAFLAGLRISATYAIVATIFAEYAGASRGLGIYILAAKNNFRADLVLAAVVVSTGLTLALLGAIRLGDRLTACGPKMRHA